MFIVDTDEDLFLRIDTTARKMRQLFVYFQNPDTEMSYEEVRKWNLDCIDYKNELNQLFNHCYDRIKPQ